MAVNIDISRLETNTGQIPGLPKNPRLIRDARFDALKQSIADLPDMLALRELLVYPIPNTDHFVIIGGNMRFRACKDLKFKELPCKILPADYDAAKLREIAIKDNVGFGDNDNDILANEWDLGELINWGMELDWDVPTLDDDSQKEITEDEFNPDESVEHRVSRGEIWQLGEHRLMCGDSTNAADVALLMDGGFANMVFTDPPYNVAIGSKNAVLNKQNHANYGGRIETDIIADKGMTDEEIGQKLWIPAFKNLYENAADDCAIYVTMPQGITHMTMMAAVKESGWQAKHELIWVKNQATFSMNRLNYDYKHEPILYGWKKKHNWFGKGEQQKSVWEFDRIKCDLHPTMKPITLIANAVLNSSQTNDIILDVFGGSGSTLMACEQTGRKCRIMELDEHYCDVILTRWEKQTGQTAVKLN